MSKSKLMNGTILQSESGRSMVEMLGVLAVIGVLTVGGIVGYRYAINKHEANVVLDTASKAAVICSPALLKGGGNCDSVLTEMGISTSDWSIDTNTYDDIFAVARTGLSRDVCRSLVGLSNDLFIVRKDDIGQIELTSLEMPDNCGADETIDVAFLYHDDLSPIDAICVGDGCAGGGCVPSHECHDGNWSYGCGESWVADAGCELDGGCLNTTYPNCAGATCTSDWRCSGGNLWMDFNGCFSSSVYCTHGCAASTFECNSGWCFWTCIGSMWENDCESSVYCPYGCGAMPTECMSSACTPSWFCSDGFWSDGCGAYSSCPEGYGCGSGILECNDSGAGGCSWDCWNGYEWYDGCSGYSYCSNGCDQMNPPNCASGSGGCYWSCDNGYDWYDGCGGYTYCPEGCDYMYPPNCASGSG